MNYELQTGSFSVDGSTKQAFSGSTYSIIGAANTWVDVKTGGNAAKWSHTVTHNADGSASVTLAMAGINLYKYASGVEKYIRLDGTYSGNADISAARTFTLSISAGTGSTITVRRGSTTLANGASITYGDTLTITCTPNTNYKLLTLTLNGSSISSGSTHTVKGAVSVVSTAQKLYSSVSATDANIGSTSIIKITRYDSSYKHTLTYSFSSKTGTIVTKTSDTTVSWTVPSSFYEEIPNSKTGTCTITCRAYDSSGNLLNTSTCSITVTASESSCRPTLSASVVDNDSTTISLTGNSNSLIRYRSDARCVITASAKNSATISSKTINGTSVSGAEKTFQNCESVSFTFSVVDSRGYKTETTVSPTVINYIPLTLSANIQRVSVNSSNLLLSVEGKYYKGSFGSYSNTLTIKYRYSQYKTSGWSDWATLPSSGYTIKTGSYSTTTPYEIIGNFDYKTQYYFEIMALDGANGVVLTTKTAAITVKIASPVFDWGADDFKFNVPVSMPMLYLTGADGSNLIKVSKFTTSAALDVAAGAAGNISVNCSETGYVPLGILGISKSGTASSYCMIYEFHMDSSNSTNARAYFRNIGTSDASITVSFSVLMLYIGDG